MLDDGGIQAMADAYAMTYGTEYYSSPAWSFETPSPPELHPPTGPYSCSRPPVIKRRTTANKKERRRTLSINNAFAELRDCIPNVPADTKLSKIKTLRLATSYIAYLMDLLAQDDPSSSGGGGFKAEICKKFESRDERRRKEMASLLSGCSSRDKRSKGRTGWPQHVWALPLYLPASGNAPPQ